MLRTWLARAWGRRAEHFLRAERHRLSTKSREEIEKAVQFDPANAEAMNDLFDFYMDARR